MLRRSPQSPGRQFTVPDTPVYFMECGVIIPGQACESQTGAPTVFYGVFDLRSAMHPMYVQLYAGLSKRYHTKNDIQSKRITRGPASHFSSVSWPEHHPKYRPGVYQAECRLASGLWQICISLLFPWQQLNRPQPAGDSHKHCPLILPRDLKPQSTYTTSLVR